MDLALFVEDTFGVRIEDTELNADPLTIWGNSPPDRITQGMTTFPERLESLHARTPERVAVYLQFSSGDDLPLTSTGYCAARNPTRGRMRARAYNPAKL
jgi:hypothetical protein